MELGIPLRERGRMLEAERPTIKEILYTIVMAIEIGLNRLLRRNHAESAFALLALCDLAHYRSL